MYGGSYDRAYGLDLDSLANVYVTGKFLGQVDFDPSPGINLLDAGSNSETAGFIQKFDSTGQSQWVAQIEGDASTYFLGLVVDSEQSIYTTGLFNGTYDFDPSNSGTVNFTSPPGWSTFILKLSESYLLNNGEIAVKDDQIITCFPNPSNERFNLDFGNAENRILRVFDIRGKLVDMFDATESKLSFELDEAPGLYILEVESSIGFSTLKIIKK